MSPAAAENVDIGIYPKLLIGALIIVIACFQIFIVKLLNKISSENKSRINKKIGRILIPIVILVIMSDKILFGFSNLFGNVEVTSKIRVIPFYQPFTFNRAAKKYFDFRVEDQIGKARFTRSGNLNYPRKEIKFNSGHDRPNIIIITLDAVRNGIISEDITPNMFEIMKESIEYKNHYSGGNASRFGVFSIFYGVNPNYWFSFLDAQRSPVLIETLKKREYEIGIFSSSDLNWPEFRKTAFVSIPDKIVDNYEGRPYEKDIKITDHFNRWIGETKTPFFAFLFLDAPHQYSYPRDYAKFMPDGKGEKNYLTVDKSGSRDILFNQYKNSIYHSDMLVGKIIGNLKERGLYDKTIIIFTADHGQEFNESGSYGHNNSFSKEQARPFFFIHIPGREPGKVEHLTSHLDISPTIMKWIGVENAPGDYSMGYDLFDPEYDRKLAFVANWNWNAIITDKNVLVFSRVPNPLYGTRIYDRISYEELDASLSNKYTKEIFEVMKQGKWFFK